MSSDDEFGSRDALKAIVAQQIEKVAYQNEHLGGALMGAQMDHQQAMRDTRIQSAVYTLTQARSIRADEALMADIRAWVAQKRNEFMLLLDDLGGAPG